MSINTQPAFGTGDASFQAAGGSDGIRRLVEDFYAIMDSEPEAAAIRRMHAQDLNQAREKLTVFLCGWLGGPRQYAERFGPISIPQFHSRWPIGEAESEAWLGCMAQAITRQNYSPEFADYLLTQLRVPATRIRQAAAHMHGCPYSG
jgi:hemoglobin